MKQFTAFALLFFALPCVTAVTFEAAPDAAGDAQSALQTQLSGMIAAGQQKLQVVEAKNVELLKNAKSKVKDTLLDQAHKLGDALSSYAGNLTTAEQSLKKAADAGQAGLDSMKSTAGEQAAFANVEAKAALTAKVAEGSRRLKRAQTKRKSAIRQAGEEALTRLDDEAMRLGSKLGDLTKEVDPAKQELQAMIDMTADSDSPPTPPPPMKDDFAMDDDAGLLSVLTKDGYDVAAKTPAPVAKVAPVTTTTAKPPVVQKKPAATVASLAALTKDLTAAEKAEADVVKREQKRLTAFMAKDEKDSKSALEKIKDDMLAERKKLTTEAGK